MSTTNERTTPIGCVALLLAMSAVGCRSQVADLGGAGPCTAPAADAGLPAACRSAVRLSDGGGFAPLAAEQCSAQDGTLLAFTSTADVAAALVGIWMGCGVSNGMNGPFPGAASSTVEFTSDGRFFLMGGSPLVRLTGPADSGTFAVIDASSTLGPGTFQVRFDTGSGGAFPVQVAVLGSPSRLRFFSPTQNDFVPAVSLAFQAGVCGPSFVEPARCLDEGDLLAQLQGRWLSCEGLSPFLFSWPQSQPMPPPFVGVEIRGSTIGALVVDTGGALVADPKYTGQLVISPGQSGSFMMGVGGQVTQVGASPAIDACNRAMVLFDQSLCGPTGGCQRNLTDPLIRMP
ncbi:MAG: hypothetical protein ACRENE_25310 [Polyangiaceae bacterium]